MQNRLSISKAFGLALIILFINACGVPENPPVFKGVDNIKVSKLSTKSVNLVARVKFYNPNDSGIKLKAVSVDVVVDGKKVAHADQTKKQKIKPKSNFVVPVELDIDLKELSKVAGILGILTGKSLDATFTGHLILSKGGVPFKVPINFKERIRLK